MADKLKDDEIKCPNCDKVLRKINRLGDYSVCGLCGAFWDIESKEWGRRSDYAAHGPICKKCGCDINKEDIGKFQNLCTRCGSISNPEWKPVDHATVEAPQEKGEMEKDCPNCKVQYNQKVYPYCPQCGVFYYEAHQAWLRVKGWHDTRPVCKACGNVITGASNRCQNCLTCCEVATVTPSNAPIEYPPVEVPPERRKFKLFAPLPPPEAPPEKTAQTTPLELVQGYVNTRINSNEKTTTWTCPQCDTSYQWKGNFIGRKVECEKCEVTFRCIAPNLTNKEPATPADPLAVQEGGSHYKSMKIQPVEYIHANGIGFLEGCAIKYLSRHQAKGGVEDVKKAKHFCDLILKLTYGEG